MFCTENSSQEIQKLATSLLLVFLPSRLSLSDNYHYLNHALTFLLLLQTGRVRPPPGHGARQPPFLRGRLRGPALLVGLAQPGGPVRQQVHRQELLHRHQERQRPPHGHRHHPPADRPARVLGPQSLRLEILLPRLSTDLEEGRPVRVSSQDAACGRRVDLYAEALGYHVNDAYVDLDDCEAGDLDHDKVDDDNGGRRD